MKNKLRENNASIVLDLAIAMPIFIFAAYFMLSAMLSQSQALVLRHALDQTCNELEVILPLLESGGQVIAGQEEMGEVLEQILPSDPSYIRSAGLDLASSQLLANFLQTRIDYWAGKTGQKMGLKLPPHERQVLLLWRDQGKSLVVRLFYQLTTPWTRHDQQVNAYVPLWFTSPRPDQSDQDNDEDEDNIWSASNFQRGRVFREEYGANLPFNMPTIASFNAGRAVAIRSLDLTAPSYQDQESGAEQIAYEIKRLATFKGAKIPGGSEIKADQIKSRELILVIPENSPAKYDQEFWSELVAQAAANDVDLIVKRKFKSFRYQSDDNH